ncbi:MAG: NTP transferase domain-containing protein [Magnetococcales bacterium]|nr:NTP transferase domain-containing protein [Magnetococcales bacterium]
MTLSAVHPLAALAPQPVDPGRWTAVIPAAGRGSRLGGNRAKLLHPVLGRPILAWLADALRPTCGQFVFILSPDNRAEVEPVLERLCGAPPRVAIQERPLGMADAVQRAEDLVTTPSTLVVWGDQVTLKQSTIAACAWLHEQRAQPTLTLPSLWRRDPYIHLERDDRNRLTRVLQAREGEIHQPEGENDCGVFLFATATLFRTLRQARAARAGLGSATGEFNLLQTLPRFETHPQAVATVRLDDPGETVGVNTPEDVLAAEAILRARAASIP